MEKKNTSMVSMTYGRELPQLLCFLTTLVAYTELVITSRYA